VCVCGSNDREKEMRFIYDVWVLILIFVLKGLKGCYEEAMSASGLD
jgi:hypothetical protein